MLDFIEPAPSSKLIDLAQYAWPAFVKLARHDLRIKIDEPSLEILQNLRDKAAVICPNHSDHDDPVVMFGISKALHEHFLFLTAREIFKHYPSPSSLWLQHIGCYSVVRAAPDVESFKATRDLLSSGKTKIVVCPEGEISHQNNRLMKIEPGPEHMTLAAARELAKRGDKHPVYIVPMAILYRYRTSIHDQLAQVVSKLEEKLSLPHQEKLGLTMRLRHAFEAMLSAQEAEYALSGKGISIDERLDNLCARVDSEVSSACGISLDPHLNRTDQLHRLKNWYCEQRFGPRKHAYKFKSNETHKIHYRTLRRFLNFVGFGEKTFDHVLTQDEAAKVANVLEHEVCGSITLLQAKRVAYVHVDQPIDARKFLSENYKDSAGALTRELQAGMERSLKVLLSQHGSILVT
jgi:1-acyl-sn-glycerol-3-phosphate acyltransferase